MDPRLPVPIIGLTGGIAAGKSYVAAAMRTRGWTILDADQAARDVVGRGTEGLQALVKAFGKEALRVDGTLDRPWLAKKVFADPASRRELEALLHPRIEAHLQKMLKSIPVKTKGVILDAALWVERGKAHHFDAFWVVDAPVELRIQRLIHRDRLSKEHAVARLAAQTGTAEKQLHADRVIFNDGRDIESQLEEAESSILANWKRLRSARWSSLMAAPFTPEQLHEILSSLLSKGGDYGEIFVEKRRAQALGMDDGRMEDVLASETFGASLRISEGETTRFADLIAPDFNELKEAALLLAAPGSGASTQVPTLTILEHPTPSPIERDPASVPFPEKVELVRKTESIARNHGETLKPGAIRQVAVGYGDSTQSVWIAVADRKNGDWKATLAEDHRTQGVLRLSVTAGEGDTLQTGFRALGETRGFELFTEEAVTHTAQEAVRMALQALIAQPAPAGTFPVILSSSAGGTMIHEACGHGLEADLALAGVSAFAGKLGTKVAADGVTIIDDGTLPHKRGSSACDDEGQPTERVVLIENGILKGYLQSRKTARRMSVPPTGNGRRESYRHLPIPRMRNTFLAPGPETPEVILKDLERGLLVKHMGGGQVDTVTGNFVFQVTEGYWVEKGEIKYPVKNATLSGCGPDVLKQITRIAGDLEHFDIGTCGKDGQGVPVSDAMPTILCPSLVVGGTAEPLPDVI